jgi:hypothetical protein
VGVKAGVGVPVGLAVGLGRKVGVGKFDFKTDWQLSMVYCEL